jgi:hypothetical protein
LILNKLMDVFFTKLPQALSLCRAKFYREQPRLSPTFADSQPFRHVTDDNPLYVHDLSLRHNPATEEGGVSPPEVFSVQNSSVYRDPTPAGIGGTPK